MSARRSFRIPLIGDLEGVVLELPGRQLSEENWQQFIRSLDVMKPGLVRGEWSKCEEMYVDINGDDRLCCLAPHHQGPHTDTAGSPMRPDKHQQVAKP